MAINKLNFVHCQSAIIFALLIERPVRLSARTSPFHGGKTGSIPVPATKERLSLNLMFSNEYEVLFLISVCLKSF